MHDGAVSERRLTRRETKAIAVVAAVALVAGLVGAGIGALLFREPGSTGGASMDDWHVG